MLAKLKGLSRVERIVFAAILALLIVKALLITPFTGSTSEFLSTYQFVFSDSYDWVANGVRIFENDAISFRNPGLVLLIKVLHNLNALFLLPLLGSLAFFALIVYIYKLCRLVSSELLSIIIAVLVALNFSFNLSAQSLLADIYAVAFIAMSFYYLVTKRYLWAFGILGISILFQNLGYFMLFIWGIHYVACNFVTLKKKLLKKDYSYFIEGLSLVTLVLLPALAWNIYKFIKFGDPLYSKVAHLELLHPNFDSVDFYFLNAVTMFGFIIIPLLVFVLFYLRKILKSNFLAWCFVGLAFNFLQWVIAYDWDDRRFLIYFIPFLFPVIAYFLQEVRKLGLTKLAVILLLFYPSILPIRSFLTSNEMPLVHNTYLQVDGGKGSQIIITAKARPGYENILMNLNPIFYSALTEYEKNHTSGSTPYSNYSNYIHNNYSRTDNSMCFDEKLGLRKYLLRTTLMLNENIDLDTVTLIEDCDAKV